MKKLGQPEPPKGMRFATIDDFSKNGYMVKDLEYHEYMIGDFVWQQEITGIDTDRAWLKSKIALGYICLHKEPILWNQNREAFEAFVLERNYC